MVIHIPFLIYLLKFGSISNYIFVKMRDYEKIFK